MESSTPGAALKNKAKKISNEVVREKDGRWRFSMMPGIALKLGVRLIKRGQKFVDLSENEAFPMPYAIPEHEDKEKGNKAPQLPEQGSGPLFYRQYTVDFSGSKLPGSALMAKIKADPDYFSPRALARYTKTKGEPGQLEIGDEFFIKMTGPWNAPVRVVGVTPLSFTFVTLQDHMEAGEIHFEIIERRGFLRFQIQSWARSRDAGVDFVYDKLKVAQLVQSEMWTSFSENVIRYSGGRQKTPVVVAVQRIPEKKSPKKPIRRKRSARA